MKYHYVRLEIQNGAVNLTYVPTDNNVAHFTKPLTRVKLDRLSRCSKPQVVFEWGCWIQTQLVNVLVTGS